MSHLLVSLKWCAQILPHSSHGSKTAFLEQYANCAFKRHKQWPWLSGGEKIEIVEILMTFVCFRHLKLLSWRTELKIPQERDRSSPTLTPAKPSLMSSRPPLVSTHYILFTLWKITHVWHDICGDMYFGALKYSRSFLPAFIHSFLQLNSK